MEPEVVSLLKELSKEGLPDPPGTKNDERDAT